MGLFDRPVRNGFDEMFDFNHDGNIDPMEFNAQMDFLDDEDEYEEEDEDSWDDEDEEDEGDDEDEDR